MPTIITRPLALVQVGGDEDEHGRGTDAPPAGTGHPHIASLGLLDDIEHEDDAHGPEDEPDTYCPQPSGSLHAIVQAGHPLLPTAGICPGCGEANEPGACNRCGAIVNAAPRIVHERPARLAATGAVCPRCGGRPGGCFACTNGQV